ncbi:aquaglyceroporin like other eukaryote [Neofusicoccum parvum]|uniref:Aquaglyceroporin like other eukaryote n=1 Tax=Neofusicoccum parvum TaxID=310453 RepID=A0ACB5S4E9_9PEZI|nr:aquaglyceroporin like other eukaryote [Neofusicoccum parvum]
MFILGVLVARWNEKQDIAQAMGTYETGFATENVVLSESLIKIEQRKFTGGVEFTEDGELFLIDAPGERVYVGEPNGDVDEAWRNILDGRYFSLTEDEAKSLWGEDYEVYRDQAVGGFTGGFDMFHSLHCLNQLRMALHRDYYPETPHHNMTHQHHCIGHLRQVIQCSGGATIIPTKWRPGIHNQYVDTAQVQTCRNFELLHEYTLRRHHGDLMVPRPKIESVDG